jgi:alkanesulfonate monooxygenase SsuD/methylene tetrahydromethanopterin reductase-like flavin-dependent oxidoreductase (luciferase family)
MTVDFGFVLVERHSPTPVLSQWMDNWDALLPKLEGHFKSLWMTDHFFWSDLYAYEAWTVLSFMAARWQQFDLGPMVIGQNYRNPALLAKMAATLQVFSKGRFIMGIGAGWKEDEYRAYNYEYPTPGVRIEQLTDTLEIIKRLWTQPGKVSYQGKHYAIHDAYLEPKPNPIPPIVVGGGGNKTMRIAAQYADWWNLPDAPLANYTERMAVLHQHCASIGRDPKSIRATWFGRMVLARTEAEVKTLAASRDKPFTSDNALLGTPAQMVEQLQAYAAAGVSYFMVDVLGLPDEDRLGLLLEEVLPKVK